MTEATLSTPSTEADVTGDVEGGASQPSLANIVRAAIHRLDSSSQESDRPDPRGLTAVRAQLRNAVGKSPQQSVLAWNTVLEDLLPELPQAWTATDAPSAQEWAAFTALTYWAMHQQSVSVSMHTSDGSRRRNFGYSVGRLAAMRDSASIKSRFDALALSAGETATLHHLRGLIQLLRASGIPTDYGLLAEDLVTLRSPGGRRRVALRWGRGFALGVHAERSSSSSAGSGSAS